LFIVVAHFQCQLTCQTHLCIHRALHSPQHNVNRITAAAALTTATTTTNCCSTDGQKLQNYKLDFIEARDSEWQWHQLGRMQVCTLLQTNNHTNTPSLNFYRPDALLDAQPTVPKQGISGEIKVIR